MKYISSRLADTLGRATVGNGVKEVTCMSDTSLWSSGGHLANCSGSQRSSHPAMTTAQQLMRWLMTLHAGNYEVLEKKTRTAFKQTCNLLQLSFSGAECFVRSVVYRMTSKLECSWLCHFIHKRLSSELFSRQY